MEVRDIPPIHPGEHLAEFLEEFEISQYHLAKEIGVPPRRINEIIHCKLGISVDTALRLGRFFNTTPEFWMNLQTFFALASEKKILEPTLQKIQPIASVA